MVFIDGGMCCYEVGVYVLFYNYDRVCADVCCVSYVIECGLFLESGSGFICIVSFYLIHTLIRKLLQTKIPGTIIKFIANYIK